MLRYVFVSTPGHGHLRLMANAAACLADSTKCEIHFIICRHHQSTLDGDKLPFLTDLAKMRFESITTLETKESIKSTDPKVFNLERAVELAPVLEKKLDEIGIVDLLIYDFFCLEAIIVARKNKIPTACSLAAFVPPSQTKIEDVFFQKLKTVGIAQDIDECEIISDGLFVSFPNQRIWLYEPEVLFPPSRYEIWRRDVYGCLVQRKVVFIPERITCPPPPPPPRPFKKSEIVSKPVETVPPPEVKLDSRSRVDVKERDRDRDSDCDLQEISDSLDFSEPEKNYPPSPPFQALLKGGLLTPEPIGTLLICLGSVVTGELWLNNMFARIEIVRVLRDLLFTASRAHDSNMNFVQRIVVSLPGGNRKAIEKLVRPVVAVFGKFECIPLYFYDWIDLPMFLNYGNVKLFVTHGGCGSVREAAMAQVPMMVVPFFGDQHESAQRVCDLYWGTACSYVTRDMAAYEDRLETTRSEWKRSMDCGDKLISTLRNLDLFKQALRAVVKKTQEQVSSFFKNMVHVDCRVIWNERDLLYGTNQDRKNFIEKACAGEQDLFNLDKCEQSYDQMYDLKSGQCPRLIDHYHDILLRKRQDQVDDPVLKKYIQFLDVNKWRMYPLGYIPSLSMLEAEKPHVNTKQYLPAHDTLWNMCALGMEFFVEKYGATIHFAIGPGFVWGRNRATTLELLHAKKLLEIHPGKIKIYVKGSGQGPLEQNAFWRRLDYSNMNRFWLDERNAIESSTNFRNQCKNSYKNILKLLRVFQKKNKSALPCHLHSRLKSIESIANKIYTRREIEMQDILGYRLVVTFTQHLELLADMLMAEPIWKIKRRVISERGRIIYLYGQALGEGGTPFEFQLMTDIIHTFLSIEHGKVYKVTRLPLFLYNSYLFT